MSERRVRRAFTLHFFRPRFCAPLTFRHDLSRLLYALSAILDDLRASLVYIYFCSSYLYLRLSTPTLGARAKPIVCEAIYVPPEKN